jgi:hypothetical protein
MTGCKVWSKGKVKMAKNSFVEREKKNFPKWMFECEFDVVSAVGWRGEIFLELKDETGDVLPVLFSVKFFEIIHQ